MIRRICLYSDTHTVCVHFMLQLATAIKSVTTKTYPAFYMKVMEDNQEIGAYMFRRTVPSTHLTPEDVRWMVCFYLNLIFSS